MQEPAVSDLRSLVSDIIVPFYQVRRATPLLFAEQRYENDAEHSWSLALFACALAPHINPRLDTGKVAQYATVHDLVEVHAGDTSNLAPESEKVGKEEREAVALRRLQSELRAFPWIIDTLESYEAQEDEEAVFVRAVDKILPLLFDLIDEGWLYKEQKITRDAWLEAMRRHREKASRHEGVFKYYEEIRVQLLANPDFFYQETTEA
ncbi:MAG TPA: HD domain-containing protein [Candidatus Saccharimonadales bacterium]|nr:HD domain-containing protein [Candidatus Saccharimonadales bacterium]